MRPFVRPLFVASLVLAVSGSLLPARAQIDSREGIALQNEIYQLRQELKTLEDQTARGGGTRQPSYSLPPPQYGGSDIVAQLLARVDALEEQVRRLRGQNDELQNQLQHQGADLDKRIDDLAFQISPQGGAASGGASPSRSASANYSPPPLPGGQGRAAEAPPPPVPTTARASGPRAPELALQDGYAALTRHDYQSAEAAAREVLANRTSPRAYDAQLLLGQALSGERQHAQAAIAFDDAYNRSHKGTHAQDALVGLANSLSAINEKKAACDTLTRLHTEFPQPRPDIRDSAAVAAQKAGCS